MKDRQSLVDRTIFRLKNNPVLAVVIIAGVVLGTLASFTDSFRKMLEVVKKFESPVQVTGDWRSATLRQSDTDTRPWQYYFKLNAVGTSLFGTVYYIEPPDGPPEGAGHGILNGKVDDNKLSFDYPGGWSTPESFYGVISRDEIHFTYHREGSVAIDFIAKRVPQEHATVAK